MRTTKAEAAYLEMRGEVVCLRLAEDHEDFHARHEILHLLKAFDVGTHVEYQRRGVGLHCLPVCHFDELAAQVSEQGRHSLASTFGEYLLDGQKKRNSG
jgi:hypothetical protein